MALTISSPKVEKPPKLIDQVRYALRTRHYSFKTEKAYIDWIKKYIFFHNKQHPLELGERHINRFLTHLAVQKKVAASTQNQALCALVFLYKPVLGKELGDFGTLIWAKKPQRLPVVLTKSEVKSILDNLYGPPWLLANLLYGAGLRLNECPRLRVKDIDFGYRQINVWEAKGAKSRITMLPKTVIIPLKIHMEKVRKLHEKDLSRGFGSVELPHALKRKYAHADKKWIWQYVFPF